MSNDQTDSSATTQSEGHETLPEEIVRYVREAGSQERRAFRSLVDELESSSSLESKFESDTSNSGASESRSKAEDERSSKVRQKNEMSEANSSSIDQTEEPPDGVPANATLTVKEINNNRYYYWQWRDGDSIRSKYKGPVQDQ